MTTTYLKQKNLKKILILSFILLSTSIVFGQNTLVGTVLSGSDNQPLPGVNVIIKGTTAGTITDANGKFNLDVPSNESILVFSMMGMLTEEILVGNQSEIIVTLIEDLIGLDEVIVVGYGTMKKSDVAGSIVSVKGAELNEVKSSNVLEALQGKVAGVNISPSSGQSGADVDINIRGERSLNASSKPLIIVDGIPQSSLVSTINPNDIESVEILKDAASTAIYGSRGANGIILITTKKGKAGTSKVYYNAYHTFSTPYQKLPIYDRDGYINAKFDAYRDYTNDSTFLIQPDTSSVFVGKEAIGFENGTATDWQDLVTRSGYIANHQVGVSGGTEKLTYNASIDYFNQKGIVIQDEFKRYTGKVSLTAKINDRLQIGNSTIVSQKINDGEGVNFTNAIKMPSIVAPYDSLDNKIYQPANPNPRINPLMAYDDTYEERTTYAFTNIFMNVKLMDGLNFRSNIGIDIEDKRQGYTYPNEDPSRSGIQNFKEQGYTWNNVLTYDKTMNDHHLIVTGVHEMMENRREYLLVEGKEQKNINSLWYNLGTSSTDYPRPIGSSLIENSMVSFLGRLNYTFREKYVFNATLRTDGASQLSDGYKWDYFPAASLAWRISQESFFSPLKNVISDLKLRASYGSTGNASIAPYRTFGGINTSPYYYEFGSAGGESGVAAYRPTSLGTKDLTWEHTDQVNLGFDFSIFTGRISGNVDFYKAFTSNMLLPDRTVPTSGYQTPVFVNAGKTETQGLEVMLQAYAISTTDFKWRINLNGTFNKEEIIELTSGVSQDELNLWFVGSPISVYYDYEKIGIWQYEDVENAPDGMLDVAKPGYIKVRDIDNDSTFTAADRTVLGQENPKVTASLGNSFTYKNWTLSFSIYGKFGHMIDAKAYAFDPRMLNNQLKFDYWTPLNPTNEAPRLDDETAGTNLPFSSTMQYKDGSFIKLRNIVLSYNLPQKFLDPVKLAMASIYVSTQNTATLYSNLEKGLDPERNGSISWPLARTFTVGINVEF